jgi:LEA14-like dessication related protein
MPESLLTGGMVRRSVCLLLLMALLPGCALFKRNLEAPRVTLQGLVPESLDRNGQVFLCRLLLENPNPEDLDVRGGAVTLELADFSAARGQTTGPFVLPAYGSREVDIRVRLDLLSTLPGLLRWAASGNPRLDYTLKGHVDLDVKALGRLPFKDTGTVNADQLLRQLPGLLRGVPDRGPAQPRNAPPAADPSSI